MTWATCLGLVRDLLRKDVSYSYVACVNREVNPRVGFIVDGSDGWGVNDSVLETLLRMDFFRAKLKVDALASETSEWSRDG